jgi:hypothetical protein
VELLAQVEKMVQVDHLEAAALQVLQVLQEAADHLVQVDHLEAVDQAVLLEAVELLVQVEKMVQVDHLEAAALQVLQVLQEAADHLEVVEVLGF